MIAFLILLFHRGLCEDKEVVAVVIKQMEETKQKFSDLVDTSNIRGQNPDLDHLLEYIDQTVVHPPSCYSQVIKSLSTNCNSASPAEETYFSLRFTECYYNLTGKLAQFPAEYPDSVKTSKMSEKVYDVYMAIKMHWRNLCVFSKQMMFKEATSNSMIKLFMAFIEGTNKLDKLYQQQQRILDEVNLSSQQIDKTLDHQKKFLDSLDVFLGYFNGNTTIAQQVIEAGLGYIQAGRLFLIFGILILIISAFIQDLWLPSSVFIIIMFLADHTLTKYYEQWPSSVYRIAFKVFFVVALLAFPVYYLLTNTAYVWERILIILRIKKSEKITIPSLS